MTTKYGQVHCVSFIFTSICDLNVLFLSLPRFQWPFTPVSSRVMAGLICLSCIIKIHFKLPSVSSHSDQVAMRLHSYRKSSVSTSDVQGCSFKCNNDIWNMQQFMAWLWILWRYVAKRLAVALGAAWQSMHADPWIVECWLYRSYILCVCVCVCVCARARAHYISVFLFYLSLSPEHMHMLLHSYWKVFPNSIDSVVCMTIDLNAHNYYLCTMYKYMYSSTLGILYNSVYVSILLVSV